MVCTLFRGVYSLTEPVDPAALKGCQSESDRDVARVKKTKRPLSSMVYEALLSNVRQRLGGAPKG